MGTDPWAALVLTAEDSTVTRLLNVVGGRGLGTPHIVVLRAVRVVVLNAAQNPFDLVLDKTEVLP